MQSSQSPELRELSSTDLKFLEEGLENGPGALCDLDTILDGFQADNHILLTNPDRLLDIASNDVHETKRRIYITDKVDGKLSV